MNIILNKGPMATNVRLIWMSLDIIISSGFCFSNTDTAWSHFSVLSAQTAMLKTLNNFNTDLKLGTKRHPHWLIWYTRRKRFYPVLESVSHRKLRDPPPRGTAWWITQQKCWPKNFTSSSSKKQKKYDIKGKDPLVGWCESGNHLPAWGVEILLLMPASDLPTRTTRQAGVFLRDWITLKKAISQKAHTLWKPHMNMWKHTAVNAN